MIIKEILNRRSVRSYKKEPVPEEYIFEVIKAGLLAPSAHNNRAVEFIIVKDDKTKEKIFEIVGQEFMKEAPVLIIPLTQIQKTNCPVEDLSVVSENIFLQATNLGLGTVWKAVREGQEKEIKKLLQIPENYTLINIIPIGWPKEKPQPYKEDEFFDLKKLHYEKW
jgi:nitroreductase